MSRVESTPLVVHLPVDYPNLHRSVNATSAPYFMQPQEELDYLVIELSRTANPLRFGLMPDDVRGDKRVVCIRYWDLPLDSLRMLPMLFVALRVRAELKRRGLLPVLVHRQDQKSTGSTGWWLSWWLRMTLPATASQKVIAYE